MMEEETLSDFIIVNLIIYNFKFNNKIVTVICKKSLNINLSKDDISRSHIKPNSRGIMLIEKLEN